METEGVFQLCKIAVKAHSFYVTASKWSLIIKPLLDRKKYVSIS